MSRYSQQDPRQPRKAGPHQLSSDVAKWRAWHSHDLLEDRGLADFADRNRHLLDRGWPHADTLLAELPEDPREVACRGGRVARRELSTGDAWTFIRDLCQRHRGEVREVQGSGAWNPWEGPLPHEVMNPQFSGSFIRVSGQMAMAGALAGALATGSTTSTGEAEVRLAKVYGLADLFYKFGAKYTAAELYSYYTSCKVIAKKRVRRQQAWTWT